MTSQSCDFCSRSIGSEALYCPYCLANLVSVEENWMAYTTTGAENSVLSHDLVPEHRLYPEQKLTKLLQEYDISRMDLPKIRISDPALQHIPCSQGDVIEIIRESRTAGKARNYRLVVGGNGSLDGSPGAGETWRNPEDPIDGTYERPDELTEEQALHVLENLRAHVPPSRPGTCDAIAVDREDEITEAVDRVKRGAPYTFIRGELGYGKSFFLHWVRDRVFPTTAVSFIDLDDSLTFQTTDEFVQNIVQHLATPRSISHDEYANGLDELWDTCLRQLADLCAGHLEGQGYELKQDLIAESLQAAVTSIFSSKDLPTEALETVEVLAGSYFDSRTQSITQHIESEGGLSGFDLLEVVSVLARCNGYNVLIGVDELEKSDRSEDHFAAIDEFISSLPPAISLFVTGTPELVQGGEEGNALRETHRTLYDRTVENMISLDPPTEDDLIIFTEQLLDIETGAIDSSANQEYRQGVENCGGLEATVSSFVSQSSPSFRAYLDYIESEA